jgi:hypothetical protein
MPRSARTLNASEDEATPKGSPSNPPKLVTLGGDELNDRSFTAIPELRPSIEHASKKLRVAPPSESETRIKALVIE